MMSGPQNRRIASKSSGIGTQGRRTRRRARSGVTREVLLTASGRDAAVGGSRPRSSPQSRYVTGIQPHRAHTSDRRGVGLDASRIGDATDRSFCRACKSAQVVNSRFPPDPSGRRIPRRGRPDRPGLRLGINPVRHPWAGAADGSAGMPACHEWCRPGGRGQRGPDWWFSHWPHGVTQGKPVGSYHPRSAGAAFG